MNILAIEEGFPPELTSARLPFEFAHELAKRGHKITVVTIFPRRYLVPRKVRRPPRGRFFYWESMNGFLVLRVLPNFKKASLIARFFEYSVLPVTLFIGGLIAGRNNDIIHCQTPPLTIGFTTCILSKILRKPIVVRIQDIHPDALVKMGLLKNRILVKIMEIIESFVYTHASCITVIAEGYRRHVRSIVRRPEKTYLIPNWADINQIRPPKKNDFRKKMGLTNKFIVTYAGTMSWPQDLETVIEAARLLKDHQDIVFLMIGDGVKKNTLFDRCKELKLSNVIFMPLQPRDEYFKILYASDVCLVPLRKRYTSPTAPSKMLEIMACKKPIIANVPFDSDVRRIIVDARSGIWVEPENPEAFSKAVLTLYNDKSLCLKLGNNGLMYVKNKLSLRACMDRYEKLLRLLINNRVGYGLIS